MSSDVISPWSEAPDPFDLALDQLDEEERTSLRRYRADPVGFARDCIAWPEGQELTGYQQEILGQLPAARRLAVRGPHGLGKTTSEAIAVLWFALTRDALGIDWKCVTTAGVWRQLEKYLWPEIHKWAKRLRWDVIGGRPWRTGEQLLDMAIKGSYGEAFAASVGDPALIEGAHADSLLFVYTEAKAIDAGIFDATEGAFSGARPDGLPEAFALAQSTPGPPAGRFYDIHTRKPGLDDWSVRHVTVEEAIAAGRISGDWATARGKQWGIDSALYANRVLGDFHASDEDSAIPLAWVEAAVERWHQWKLDGCPEPAGRQVFGVDVARTGSDRTVYATLQGDILRSIVRRPRQSTMVTAGEVFQLLESPRSAAVIDVTGLGAGVYDRVREQGRYCHGFVAAAATGKRDRTGDLGFVNCRSAAVWNVREMLDPAYEARLALPDDDLLIGDLTAPKWRVTSGGKIAVEMKADVAKRLGRSPDDGDAVTYACWFSSAPRHDSGIVVEAVPWADAVPADDGWDVEGAAVPFT